MKKLILFLSMIIGNSAFAGSGPLLLGAMIGDPTGIISRYEIGNNRSIDGGFAYSLGGRSGVQMHADYLITEPDSITAGDTDLDVYYGIGARLITLNSGNDKGKVAFGPRAPLGISHEIKDPSVEFFGEVAMILDLIPSTSVDLDLAVGIRYRF